MVRQAVGQNASRVEFRSLKSHWACLLTPCAARRTDVTCCDIEAAIIGMKLILGVDL